mmetsp:Transcript_100/g.467  ORF Transcript_100/g.467 Transcript_100/m.467 type:complete len:371 (-) Transcript_100:479-1591(-)
MTRYESNPSAALMRSFPLAAHTSVGSHLLSRVSVSRYTQSCASMRSSSRLTSSSTAGTSASGTGCPGIGIVIRTPSAFTPGKILRSALAAASAFGLPPPRQSSNSNSDWRTGLEKDTSPPSTNVTPRTPHPSRHLATAHPNVPAPSSRHRVDATSATRNCGSSLHRMSLRFRSTAWDASLAGSIDDPRFASRGPGRPLALTSQPTPFGSSTSASETTGRTHSNTGDARGHTRPASLRTASTRTRRGAPAAPAVSPAVSVSLVVRTASHDRTFRSAQPGCPPDAHGSTNASVHVDGSRVRTEAIDGGSHVPVASSTIHHARAGSPASRRSIASHPREISSAIAPSSTCSASGPHEMTLAGTSSLSAGNANQ